MHRRYNKTKSKSIEQLDNNSLVLKKLLGDYDQYKYSIDVAKYKKDFVRMSETACSLGADDKKLAELFDVHLSTISAWKKKHTDFNDALVRGRDEYNVTILESSLMRRAEGMSVEIVTTDAEGNVKTKVKEIPPDIEAIKFGLKNRSKDRWKESSEVQTNVNHNLDLAKLDTNQIENLIELIQSADSSEAIDCEVIERG